MSEMITGRDIRPGMVLLKAGAKPGDIAIPVVATWRCRNLSTRPGELKLSGDDQQTLLVSLLEDGSSWSTIEAEKQYVLVFDPGWLGNTIYDVMREAAEVHLP